ncbi:MAG: lipid-A-disaccharide synthase N-terminal domain-containing protein [Planctomycetota bacterium]
MYQHIAEIWAKCDLWAIFGFIGQTVFGLRFVYQWIVSERRKESIIPIAFWYMSIVGSVILLAYAIKRADPVFILGFAFNCFVYVRNLMFIYQKQAQEAKP